MDVTGILTTICKEYQRILEGNLVGIYLHGSLAFGCFHWEGSDIDFIAVVEKGLDTSTKLELLQVLEELRPHCPPKGLEMSIVKGRHCRPFCYPTPYELHYSNGWVQAYQSDPMSLCGSEEKCDPDLAAHFTVIRQVGQVLYGRPVQEVFGQVDRAFFLDSVLLDVQDAEREIQQSSVYLVLNLCRVFAYLREERVLSKEQGGEWGLEKLPAPYHPVIQLALVSYKDGSDPDVNGLDLPGFARFMLGCINSYFE